MMKICGELVSLQFARGAWDCQSMKRRCWSNNVFLDDRMNLWYWLHGDCKEDQSREEWVCFQRISTRRTDEVNCQMNGCKAWALTSHIHNSPIQPFMCMLYDGTV